MKLSTLILLPLFFFSFAPVRGDEIEEKMAKFEEDYESLRKAIRLTEDKELQKKYWDSFRTICRSQYHVHFSGVNPSDELNEEAGEDFIIESVYGAFTWEQFQYSRTIRHTEGNDDRARELMGRRAKTLCRMFPIGSRKSQREDISFMVIMLRTYEDSREVVSEALREQLPRWNGEERLTALVVAAHEGSEEAAAELRTMTSERSEKLKMLSETLLKSQSENEAKQRVETEPGEKGTERKTP